MSDPRLAQALHAWGLRPVSSTLVAARENTIYRIDTEHETWALRIHRPGLRSQAMLRSELQWMAMLRDQGLSLPCPRVHPSGQWLLDVQGAWVDVLSWTPGEPLGQDGTLLPHGHDPQVFFRLGAEMARLHDASDRWAPPADFSRPAWDAPGLVGQQPLWGCFWQHPDLDREGARLLTHARQLAAKRLSAYQGDYGLIHADLVPENVMLCDGHPQFIDFDDGGWGYRLFDLATSMNRADRAEPDGHLSRALCEGYLSVRSLDLAELPLFRALRAFTYLGWIMPRLREPGAQARSLRFITAALQAAHALIAADQNG